MSIDRIKSISQKLSGGYSDAIPFGADGKFIDMASNLDLLELFKIGGTHWTYTIQPTELYPDTLIHLRYYNKDLTVKYSVLTIISNTEDDYIITEKTSEILYISAKEDDLNIVLRKEIKNTTYIHIYLYDNDCFLKSNIDNFENRIISSYPDDYIHHKYIVITENDNGNIFINLLIDPLEISQETGGN